MQFDEADFDDVRSTVFQHLAHGVRFAHLPCASNQQGSCGGRLQPFVNSALYLSVNYLSECFVVHFSAKCGWWRVICWVIVVMDYAQRGHGIGCGNEPRNGGYAGAALMFVAVSQGFSIYA